jgi:hypothetical protein
MAVQHIVTDFMSDGEPLSMLMMGSFNRNQSCGLVQEPGQRTVTDAEVRHTLDSHVEQYGCEKVQIDTCWVPRLSERPKLALRFLTEELCFLLGPCQGLRHLSSRLLA